ncbi:unnamed protein product [Rotaria sp. Silwood2]|nr:unnamed protein product [Rotaria sp. Silwood2]
MLADELARAQVPAAIQVEARNARHEAPSRSPSTLKYTSSAHNLDLHGSVTNMEDYRYSKIIDSIPTFSGEPLENISDWLAILSLKSDIIRYNSRQKSRSIPQYLAGSALKWHLSHFNKILVWDDYVDAITPFSRIITTSQDMNLKMLKNCKQDYSEPSIQYYRSVIELCRKHGAEMVDPH